MDRLGLSVLTATLLLLPALTLAQLPSGACYSEDVTCKLQDDNLGSYSIHIQVPLPFDMLPTDASVGTIRMGHETVLNPVTGRYPW